MKHIPGTEHHHRVVTWAASPPDAANNDKVIIYAVTSGPTKGTVTDDSRPAFTHTPTADERGRVSPQAPATTPGWISFTVTVDLFSGHGGVVPVTVNVRIGAANIKPTGASDRDEY